MNSCIMGIATAVPPYEIRQTDALRQYLSIFKLDPQQEKQLISLYENSGIEKRHIVCPDFLYKDKSKWGFWGKEFPHAIPGMNQRNNLYKKEAPLLARNAAEKVIKAWGGDVQSITHIISISCTGVLIPSIEFLLMETLGLKRTVNRIGLNFMGCFGAFKGLEMANVIASTNPNYRVLVVCTELCSIHFQAGVDAESLLANSIFADGAAAVIVGRDPTNQETPLWKIVTNYSYGCENSLNQMSWEAGDYGFMMRLSNYVPISIARHIKPFVEMLLDSREKISACTWAIHPGGKAILHLIEKKLELKGEQTQTSWTTLSQYGNMSSSTFLFVLNELAKNKNAKEWTAGVGFGPGLSLEGILLQLCC